MGRAQLVLGVVGGAWLLLAGATPGAAQVLKSRLEAPLVGIVSASLYEVELEVCAGASGAPAGFSIQWMTRRDFDSNGGWPPSDDPRLCKASFSGQPSLNPGAASSGFMLGPGQCVRVRIGDLLFDETGASSNCAGVPLECGTEYVFRSFAHAYSFRQRSDFTPTLVIAAAPCDQRCLATPAYWKAHGPAGAQGGTAGWPTPSLTLGEVSYTDHQLVGILNASPAGNGLVPLARQMIAAKLNIAKGADGTAAAGALAAADALVGRQVVPPVGSGFLFAAQAAPLTLALDDFNNGRLAGAPCAPNTSPDPTRTAAESWGRLKRAYR